MRPRFSEKTEEIIRIAVNKVAPRDLELSQKLERHMRTFISDALKTLPKTIKPYNLLIDNQKARKIFASDQEHGLGNAPLIAWSLAKSEDITTSELKLDRYRVINSMLWKINGNRGKHQASTTQRIIYKEPTNVMLEMILDSLISQTSTLATEATHDFDLSMEVASFMTEYSSNDSATRGSQLDILQQEVADRTWVMNHDRISPGNIILYHLLFATEIDERMAQGKYLPWLHIGMLMITIHDDLVTRFKGKDLETALKDFENLLKWMDSLTDDQVLALNETLRLGPDTDFTDIYLAKNLLAELKDMWIAKHGRPKPRKRSHRIGWTLIDFIGDTPTEVNRLVHEASNALLERCETAEIQIESDEDNPKRQIQESTKELLKWIDNLALEEKYDLEAQLKLNKWTDLQDLKIAEKALFELWVVCASSQTAGNDPSTEYTAAKNIDEIETTLQLLLFNIGVNKDGNLAPMPDDDAAIEALLERGAIVCGWDMEKFLAAREMILTNADAYEKSNDLEKILYGPDKYLPDTNQYYKNEKQSANYQTGAIVGSVGTLGIGLGLLLVTTGFGAPIGIGMLVGFICSVMLEMVGIRKSAGNAAEWRDAKTQWKTERTGFLDSVDTRLNPAEHEKPRPENKKTTTEIKERTEPYLGDKPITTTKEPFSIDTEARREVITTESGGTRGY
ncbi:MAG: hypothetical protein JXR42_03220 [Gammaproteobacteria bacterium]|nr:hypothetical protein [Gammaproteobacteria bacterium]